MTKAIITLVVSGIIRTVVVKVEINLLCKALTELNIIIYNNRLSGTDVRVIGVASSLIPRDLCSVSALDYLRFNNIIDANFVMATPEYGSLSLTRLLYFYVVEYIYIR